MDTCVQNLDHASLSEPLGQGEAKVLPLTHCTDIILIINVIEGLTCQLALCQLLATMGDGIFLHVHIKRITRIQKSGVTKISREVIKLAFECARYYKLYRNEIYEQNRSVRADLKPWKLKRPIDYYPVYWVHFVRIARMVRFLKALPRNYIFAQLTDKPKQRMFQPHQLYSVRAFNVYRVHAMANMWPHHEQFFANNLMDEEDFKDIDFNLSRYLQHTYRVSESDINDVARQLAVVELIETIPRAYLESRGYWANKDVRKLFKLSRDPFGKDKGK